MTTGEKCADAVREYLAVNGITQRKLTGRLLAQIIDSVLQHEAELAKKKKRLATEEEWLRELEAEPHLKALNIRLELAHAQFWAKNNGRVCTRKFFVNWLGKAARTALLSPGGATSQAKANAATEPAGPSGWLATLNELFPDSVYSRGGLFELRAESDYQWQQLPVEVRQKIRRSL